MLTSCQIILVVILSQTKSKPNQKFMTKVKIKTGKDNTPCRFQKS